MTTIAYKDGVLASDTLGNPKGLYAKKIYKLSNNIWLTGAGDYCYVQNSARALLSSPNIKLLPDLFMKGDFVRDHFMLPELKDTTVVVFWKLKKEKDIVYATINDNWVSFVSDIDPMAWGSGEEYALGAMEAGADALEAIEIAKRYDIQTGGNVEFEELL